MRAHRLLPVALLTAAATLGAALAPTGQTEARWHQSLSVPLPDGASDRFTSTAVDVDSPRGAVTNTPAIDVTNTGERHSAWVNVQSTQVNAGTLGGQALASALTLGYSTAPVGGTCPTSSSPYWTARATGQITIGTTYARTQDRVATATAIPGQARRLCLGLTSSLADRDLFLAHAGRDLLVRTVVNQRTESPATWDSGPETVDSRFRVAFPRPTPWNDVIGTLSNSCASSGLLGAVQLRWAWPDGAVRSTTTTPTVNAWEVWRRASGGTDNWSLVTTVTGGDRSVTLQSGVLPSGTWDHKIIARLDPSRRAWVESTHRIAVRQNLASLSCVTAAENTAPNPGGPVVLP